MKCTAVISIFLQQTKDIFQAFFVSKYIFSGCSRCPRPCGLRHRQHHLRRPGLQHPRQVIKIPITYVIMLLTIAYFYLLFYLQVRAEPAHRGDLPRARRGVGLQDPLLKC